MSDNTYVGVHIQGGLLPGSLLPRLTGGQAAGIGGLTGADYGLAHGETVREAANRVWAYLTTVWSGYRSGLAELPATDRATSLTRDRWLQILLDQLGYGRLPLTGAGGIEVEGKKFPVSHAWGTVPVHLLGARVDLDRRTAGVAGAAGQAPQSMIQELLNRSDVHLWAILSNGLTLRLLRDSTSLVGSAYVEFDLEAIFDGDLFSDFVVLFTLCHASRLEVRDAKAGPGSTWVEQWREIAIEDGSRALDQLRDGVVDALQALGSGFLGHPDNLDLRRRLEVGVLRLADYNHALLRVVYRLLLLFVAEDRGVLLQPDADAEARARYRAYFSTDRLRSIAHRRRGGRHSDRWRALHVVVSGLGSEAGQPEIAIGGMGGLFDRGELDFLLEASLSNEALLSAVRSMSLVRERNSGQLRVVNFRDLDAEELGSVYESLLEYVPAWDPARRSYTLAPAAGNARRTTGSYYTPTSLIESLLDMALDPALDAAEKRGVEIGDVEREILRITVCDPACGSGHFLVAAARRLAKRLAAARTGDPEPPPEQVRTALRQVIGSCIYGVDINPLAAELAKVSLWLEAMEPGKPLAFLDAQIKVGNALIGVTPALLARGIPQEAFKPIDGDDRKVTVALARRNKDEAGGQGSLFGADEARRSNADLAAATRQFVGTGLSLVDVHIQQQKHMQYVGSPTYRRAKRSADAWCAAFVWTKSGEIGALCPTNAVFDELCDNDIAGAMDDEIARLSAEYRFFHWHLEFPHVFSTGRSETDTADSVTGWYGGFTVVLGNPPWIAHAGRAAQPLKRGVPGLLSFSNPAFAGYRATHSAFVRRSAELLSKSGRLALVLPTSIADLDGYLPARVAHDELAAPIQPLPSFGDGAFRGVFQPCMALVSLRLDGPATLEPPYEWALIRDDLDATGEELLRHFLDMPALPKDLFAELGFQTSAETKRLLRPLEDAAADDVPILEGKDVAAFATARPRLAIPRNVLGSRMDRQVKTKVLVRQTARFPIVGISPGVAFRNSLIAVQPRDDWTAELLLGILNSNVCRWLHFHRFRDAREGMPQVKVGHLRRIPAGPNFDGARKRAIEATVSELLTGQPPHSPALLRRINELVAGGYDLSAAQRDAIDAWAATGQGAA